MRRHGACPVGDTSVGKYMTILWVSVGGRGSVREGGRERCDGENKECEGEECNKSRSRSYVRMQKPECVVFVSLVCLLKLRELKNSLVLIQFVGSGASLHPVSDPSLSHPLTQGLSDVFVVSIEGTV